MKPLFTAVTEGDTVEIKRLLKNGADVHHTDTNGLTALHIAAKQRNTEVIQLLIEKGAKIDATDMYSRTPLHSAFYCNNVEGLRLLLKKRFQSRCCERQEPISPSPCC